MTISASPLTWPPTFPRLIRRESGSFKTTLPKALDNVQRSLKLFAADSGKKIEGLVISSNYSLGVASPPDPGVAVWFVWDGLQVCIPVDRYQKIEGNLQAIHHIIEARRTELRHGTLALVRATFTGFKALPAPVGSTWRDVFGYTQNTQPTMQKLEADYRDLRSKSHPDKGGTPEQFNRVVTAYEQAKRDLGL